MRKNIKPGKIFITLIILLSPLFSDGSIYYYYPDKEKWEIGGESKQVATILYEKGKEHLLISVLPVPHLLESVKEGVWIIPVPSDPKNIKIEIKEDFPIFKGINYFDYSWNLNLNISTLFVSLFLSAPVGFLNYFYIISSFRHKGVRGVEFYQKTEKYGIHAEVLSARKAEDLYNYLKTKNIELPKNAIDNIDYYIGKNYSFVFCRFGEEFIEEMKFYREDGIDLSPSLYIEFPAEKIYYPLKLTGAYGNRKFHVKIQIIGFVSPQIPSELKPYTNITYDVFPSTGLQVWTVVGDELAHKRYTVDTIYEILNSKPLSEEMPFTLINIKGPAKTFKKDIYIINKKPFKIKVKEILGLFLNVLIFLPVSFAFLSFLSIFICNVILRAGLCFKSLIKLTGWSFLGLPGFIFMLLRMTQETKGKRKKILFTFLYIFLFIVLTFIYRNYLMFI